jgi:RHS repeat-associated protein
MKPMRRALDVIGLVLALAATPCGLQAQTCPPSARQITGTIGIGDGSTQVPTSGYQVFAHCPPLSPDGMVAQLPAGQTQSVPATGPNLNISCTFWGHEPFYFPSVEESGMTCTADTPPPNASCGGCSGSFSIKLYAKQGGIDGLITPVPSRTNAVMTVCVRYASNNSLLGCGESNSSGYFDFRSQGEPAHSNNWGVPVSVPGGKGGPGTQDYLVCDGLNGDCKKATVSSSKLTTVSLMGKASYMRPPDMRPKKRPAPAPQPPCVIAGKPVSVLNGNVWFDQTDASIATLAGGLSMTRSYNSLNAYANLGGAFGPGWTHTYERKLSFPEAGVIELQQSNGAPIYFNDANSDLTFVGSVPLDELSAIVQVGVAPNRTFTRSFPAGGSEVYDDSGSLVSTVDPSGNVTTFVRNAAGRLATVSSGSRSLNFTYSAVGRITGISGPLGQLATYVYDSTPGNMLQKVTYPDGSGYTFTYNIYGQVLTVSDLSGRIVETHTYSGSKGITSDVGSGVEKYTLNYDQKNKTIVTDALGNVTTYEWTPIQGLREVTKVAGPCSGCGGGGSEIEEWTYNDEGQITSYKNGVNIVTTYDYDAATGDLLVVTEAAGTPDARSTVYTYDAQHRVLTVSGPGGTLTTYTHGPAGPLTITEKVSATENRVTIMTYRSDGRTETVTDPRNKVTTLGYNAEGDLASVTDPLSHATTFGYDLMGRRTTVTDALSHTTTTVYDAVGRVAQSIAHDGTHTDIEYDRGGRRTKVTDPLGRATRFTYDRQGRLSTVVDAMSGVTAYGYDLMSRLTSLTDSKNQATAFDYDTSGRVKKTTYPGGAFESFTYDPVGRLWTKTDRKNVTTTFTYDSFGRLTGKTYSNGESAVSYTYDAADRMLTAVNGVDTLTWTYDLSGQVLTEASTKNSSAVAYTYDAAGNRLELTLDGTLFVSYGYDDASRLTTITRGSNVFGFGYDNANRRTLMTYPNGVNTAYGYDNLDRLLSIVATKTPGTTIASSAYTYDAVGNRVTKTHPEYAETYAYDPLYRLTAVDRTGIAKRQRYVYDTVGARISEQVDDDVTSYSYNNRNQLLSTAGGGMLRWRGTLNEPGNVSFTSATVNGKPAQMLAGNMFEADIPVASGAQAVTLVATDSSNNTTTKNYGANVSGTARAMTYDANGNLLTNGSKSYEWDADDQLLRVIDNGNEIARFNYDALGRRVEKVAAGTTTAWVYDDDDVLREAIGSSITTFIDGDALDEPLAEEKQSGALTYLHADALGSILRSSSAAGAVVASQRYDAWGRIEAGGTVAHASFAGREWDAETGLFYNRTRYYDPNAGQFISEDPLGWAGGLNLYRYVSDAPTLLVDPTGMAPQPYDDADYQCLLCTVYAETRGKPACAPGVISAIMNRQARWRNGSGRPRRPQDAPLTLCQVVSAPKQFDGYANFNYANCTNCTAGPAPMLPDLPEIETQVSGAFKSRLAPNPRIEFFANRGYTNAVRNRSNGTKRPKIPVRNCTKLVFFGN